MKIHYFLQEMFVSWMRTNLNIYGLSDTKNQYNSLSKYFKDALLKILTKQMTLQPMKATVMAESSCFF